MRFIKILLVLVFAVTAVLYTMNDLRNTLSDTDEGPVLTCSEQTLSVSVSGGRQALMHGLTHSQAVEEHMAAQTHAIAVVLTVAEIFLHYLGIEAVAQNLPHGGIGTDLHQLPALVHLAGP